MSKDILFNVTEKKKAKAKTKQKTPLKSSGLSTKSKPQVASLDIFSDAFSQTPSKINSPTPPPSEKSRAMPKKDENFDALNPDEKINSVLETYPEIKDYVFLRPITDITLSPQEILNKIKLSAEESCTSLGKPGQIISEKSAELDEKYNELVMETILCEPPPLKVAGCKGELQKAKKTSIPKIKLPVSPSWEQRYTAALISLLPFELIKILQENNDKILTILSKIIILANIISKNPGTKEIKLKSSKLESDIVDFATTNPRYLQKFQYLEHLKYRITKINSPVPSINNILNECRRLFDQTTSYFPDLGFPQTDFETLLDMMSPEDIVILRKRQNLVVQKPETIGKQILAACSNFAQKNQMNDDSTQYLFLLYARSFFSKIYDPRIFSPEVQNSFQTDFVSISEQVHKIDCSDFSQKIEILRKVTPIGFGFLDNFLEDPMHKSFPISQLPNGGGIYKAAISLLRELPFHSCPIDFCKGVDNALREIQNQASKNSFEKLSRAGKLTAKSEHLLCLDDLFDISLIILILSDPVPIYPLVKVFEPFIAGLELPSELEFAFTNVSAMIKHIEDMDINLFLEEAKKRTAASMEIDPLNIL